jgi:hypothetical protein
MKEHQFILSAILVLSLGCTPRAENKYDVVASGDTGKIVLSQAQKGSLENDLLILLASASTDITQANAYPYPIKWPNALQSRFVRVTYSFERNVKVLFSSKEILANEIIYAFDRGDIYVKNNSQFYVFSMLSPIDSYKMLSNPTNGLIFISPYKEKAEYLRMKLSPELISEPTQVRCLTDTPNYALHYNGPNIHQPVFGGNQFDLVSKNPAYFKFYRHEDCSVRLVEGYEKGKLLWADIYESSSLGVGRSLRAHRKLPDGSRIELSFDENGNFTE